ncbi:MAG: hypothetical protein QF760_02050 [Candidatus Thalassarchaeaceae archaeon]|jgi:flagellin FlaB|nr:hypothetical protein [Candidatus Thalassarchaeaceae archaeon]MDP6703291.1 hypothetical protein [Candidatus Thalassarchaeaceae archaeon]MDP7004062.1 hypothetical protein [Candidatus Thalassarchaeaceae archaeon]
MSDEYQMINRDREAGSIGIGAMIVFIALILVAAVASTIIIKTAEELQQNAESTSDDTRKEISGKISVIQVLVNGSDTANSVIDSLIVTAKVASGSTDVQVQDITWVITCKEADGTFGLITGNIGTNGSAGQVDPDYVNADQLDGTDYTATQELDAGTVFKFDIDLDTSAAGVAGAGACATSTAVGETVEMKVVVNGGGTTILELQVETITSGKEVT